MQVKDLFLYTYEAVFHHPNCISFYQCQVLSFVEVLSANKEPNRGDKKSEVWKSNARLTVHMGARSLCKMDYISELSTDGDL